MLLLKLFSCCCWFCCCVSPLAANAPGLDWDTEKEKFGDTVIDTIAEYAPNIRDIILHRQVLTPLDLEREFGLTEGNIFQGELTLEQLFFLRPCFSGAEFFTSEFLTEQLESYLDEDLPGGGTRFWVELPAGPTPA